MVENEYNNDQSSFEMIRTIDNERSTKLIWDMISTSIHNENDFSQLKLRIRSFVKDHPLIVSQLDKCLSNHLIDHFLKKFLRVEFSLNDREETKKYVQKVINEQYSNIGEMISYFVNDIRLIILTGNYSNLPWSIRKAIILSPNSVLVQGILTWLYLKGSEKITNILFENLLQNSNENEKENLFSFEQQNVKIFLFILLFLLISININPIAFLINIIGIIVFLIVIFVYSFIYLKKLV